MYELENLTKESIEQNHSHKEHLLSETSIEPREHKNKYEHKIYGIYTEKKSPRKLGNLNCFWDKKILIGNDCKIKKIFL